MQDNRIHRALGHSALSLRSKPAILVAVSVLIGLWMAGVGQADPTPGTVAPIPDSQSGADAPAFVGTAATSIPLTPKPDVVPWVSTMHGDTDNANVSNFPGPVGNKPQVRSTSGQIAQFVWHRDGRLTSGFAEAGGHTGLAAVDPATLRVLARWNAPEGANLNFAYMSLGNDDAVLISSKQGHIFRVLRTDSQSGPEFTITRDIDVHAQLQPGEELLDSAVDRDGNIWFTTGAIHQVDARIATTVTLGYVTPGNDIRVLHLMNQTEEKGITVHGDTVFVLTAPAGTDDHPDAIGTLRALRAGPNGPETLWQTWFDAGSGIKPGGFARGSGTTPAVLGDRYLGIVDNADRQVHLLIYRQDTGALTCRVPLFTVDASYTDIGAIGYEDGDLDSLVVLNGLNGPPLTPDASGIDGQFNNMDGMAPGVARIDVEHGGCAVVWQTPERVKSVPVLSTRTGIIYAYTQDPDAAKEGRYVWYFDAMDFRTGRVVWKVRAGTGGAFNDTYHPGSLGPDGTFYQTVARGVVALRDTP